MKMKNRFKLMSLLLAMSVAISFNACSDDDDDNNGDDTDNNDSLVLVTENITSDETWTNDKIYQLGGRIAVTNGAKLTIEEGTIIKGEVGTGANASALIVARGAQIDAEGTPEKPI